MDYEKLVKKNLKAMEGRVTAYMQEAVISAGMRDKKLLIVMGNTPGDKSASSLAFIIAKAARKVEINNIAVEYAPDDKISLETADLSNPTPDELKYFFCTRHLKMQPSLVSKYPVYKNDGMGLTEKDIPDYESHMFQQLADVNQHVVFYTSNPIVPAAIRSPLLAGFEVVPIVANYVYEPLPPGIFPLMEKRQIEMETNSNIIHRKTPELEIYSNWKILSLVTSEPDWRQAAELARREGKVKTIPYLGQGGHSPN